MPKPLKILLVEDEAEFSTALVGVLKAEGLEVLLATDGRQGLAMARKERPDLVLLDLMLPELDGYKVCRFLKFDEQFKKTPVLILTAKAQSTDRALGEKVGADGYLLKSEDPKILLAKIRELLP